MPRQDEGKEGGGLLRGVNLALLLIQRAELDGFFFISITLVRAGAVRIANTQPCGGKYGEKQSQWL